MDYTVPVSQARAHLPQLIKKVKYLGKHCVLTKNGKAAIIMVSPEELETLEIMADKNLMRRLIQAEEDIKAKKIFSHKQVFSNV